MKLAIRSTLAVLALTSWAAQAATFEVPLEGFWRYGSYAGSIFSPCHPPYLSPSYCAQGSLAGTFMEVTTPSSVDGTYSAGVGLQYSISPIPDLGLLNTMTYSPGDSPDAPFTVDIFGGRVRSITGEFEVQDDVSFDSYDISFSGHGFRYLAGQGAHTGVLIGAVFAPVPEPESGVLLLAGLVALGVGARRRVR